MTTIHAVYAGLPPQIVILHGRESLQCEFDPPVGAHGIVIRFHGDHLDAYRHDHTWQCGKLVRE